MHPSIFFVDQGCIFIFKFLRATLGIDNPSYGEHLLFFCHLNQNQRYPSAKAIIVSTSGIQSSTLNSIIITSTVIVDRIYRKVNLIILFSYIMLHKNKECRNDVNNHCRQC